MAARTEHAAALLAALIAAAAPAGAQPAEFDVQLFEESDELEEETWSVESFRMRFSYFVQDGLGFQSKDGPADGPGSQEIVVIQPQAQLDLRQGDDVTHTIFFPVDLVTAASANALDAISQASWMNEAAALDVTTRYEATDDVRIGARYGIHYEEPMTSLFMGLGASFDLAEDNATLSINTMALVDLFDWNDPNGKDLGVTNRATYNADVSLSQLLSPTTVAAVTYGFTHQRGTLQQTWNSVPIIGSGERAAELFPSTRSRHAAGVKLAQHVPWTRSTLKASYRFYHDSFGLDAHSVEVQAFQYILPRLYVRGSYRFHSQDGVDFFSRRLRGNFDRAAPRTADSDLAPFDSTSAGAKVVYLFNPAGSSKPGSEYFDMSFERYFRDDLHVNVFSLAYGTSF